ncbi:uncharacterized protein LOC144441476 isoform X2 [Glandiceps talaboti]
MSSVGMKDEHRQLLRRLKPDIIKDLNAGKVVECMSDIFDEEDEQNITYSKPPIDQARKLIDILLTKGPTAFDKFVTACESCHKHIAKKLKEESGSTDAQSQDAVLKEAIMFIYNEVTLAQCLKVTRCLGLSTVDQDTIRNNFQNDAETQKHRMFVKWQEKKKQNANVDELVKQLNENGCTQQSEDMLKHLQEKGYDHLALSFGNLQISSPDQSARQPVQCTTTQDQVPTHSQGAAASVTSQRGVVAPPPPPPVAPPPSDPVLSQEAEDDFKSLPDFTATQFQSLMKRLKITKEQQRQIGENELSVWNFINFWGNSKQRQTAREVVKAVEKLLKRSDIGNTLRKHLQPGTAGIPLM